MGRAAVVAAAPTIRTAVRAPDIVVPLYSPPYTLPFAGNVTYNFDTNSPNASFAITRYTCNNVSSGALPTVEQYLLGPTVFGRTRVNTSMGLPNKAGLPQGIVFGDIYCGIDATSGFGPGNSYTFYKFPILLGIDKLITNKTQDGVLVNYYDSYPTHGTGAILGGFPTYSAGAKTMLLSASGNPSAGNPGSPVLGGYGFGLADFQVAPVIGFSLDKGALFAGSRLYTSKGGINKVDGWSYGFTGTDPGWGATIPDYNNDINYWLGTSGGLLLLTVFRFGEFPVGSIGNLSYVPVTPFAIQQTTHFDQAAFETAFNGGGATVSWKATPVGWLASCTNFLSQPGQAFAAVLLSADGSKYSLIRFDPQDGVAARVVNEGTGTPNQTIDGFGVYYYSPANTDTNIPLNSFGFNLPWPPLAIAPGGVISLPNEFCPCWPVPINSGKL